MDGQVKKILPKPNPNSLCDNYLGINMSIRYVVRNKCGILLSLLFDLAAADEGGEGPEGTAPKTVAPLEFVVFKTEELVLVEGY